MFNAIQILGAVLVLAAFAGVMFGAIDMSGYRYLFANAVGSALLTYTAVVRVEWGFIVLEGTWASVSVYSILRKAVR